MALLHEALIYDDDEKFVAVLAPFLAEGVRRREAAVAVVPEHHAGPLREGLGADADEVRFIESADWYRRPASTIAGWSGLVADAIERGYSSVRIVGEVEFGAGERHDSWTRYESALNDVFATLPGWAICPYDTRRLPGRVVADALRTHPVVRAGRRAPSELYEEPDDLLRAMAEPLPPVSPVPLVALRLTDPLSVRRARRTIEAIAHNLGWDRAAVSGLLLVVSEIALNSLIHGRGDRRIHIWAEQSSITCEVIDDGDGLADPLAGYRPPENPRSAGVGLWLANQLSDWLSIEHRDGANRVRFRFSR
ncbi:sensor histidine kinase [Actinoplanes subtropicus]|uniref:sensor histidine kinase n=1 Tax=Actinoplanes subtropicus TaxID=543632 RepID=UPI0004C3F3EC|nr:sensor histidine kinase [Actinoplanes subtropicus]